MLFKSQTLLKSQTLPKGWSRPDFTWHRVWHSRRVWQWKARAVAVCTLLALIAVILGADKLWLLAGLLGVLLPIPLDKTQTLLEIEQAQGEIYTTALVAPEDSYGFSKRLLENAKYIVRNAELPGLPWLEGLGIVLLASLAFVIPAQTKTLESEALAVNHPQTVQPLENAANDSQTAPPVLNAPAAGAAPEAGQGAANGKAASGGTPGENGVGDTRPGGGNATDDPEAISRDYLDALERGAVKSQGGQQKAGSNAKTVEDLNSKNASQNGQDQAGSSGQSGQSGRSGQNGQKGGQSGQQPGAGQQNKGQQGQNGQGQQNGSNNTSNPNGSGAQGKQNKGANGKNSQKNGGVNGSGQDRFDRGENGDSGSFPGQSPNSQQGRSQPGKAGRGGGLGNRPNGLNGQKNGKLEYLPGESQGNQVRSGAMQLPGDPRRPLTLTPGTPAYQRAVENAVLDPRLPPEYQELLKNYYK